MSKLFRKILALKVFNPFVISESYTSSLELSPLACLPTETIKRAGFLLNKYFTKKILECMVGWFVLWATALGFLKTKSSVLWFELACVPLGHSCSLLNKWLHNWWNKDFIGGNILRASHHQENLILWQLTVNAEGWFYTAIWWCLPYLSTSASKREKCCLHEI